MREDDLSLLCSGQEDSLHIQDNCVAQNLLLSLDPDNNKLRGRTSIMWGVADLWSCYGNCQHTHCERCTGVHFKQMWLPILCRHLLQKLSHKTHMQLLFLEWQRYKKMAHVSLNGTVSLYLCVGALRLCRNSRRQKEIDEYTKFCSGSLFFWLTCGVNEWWWMSGSDCSGAKEVPQWCHDGSAQAGCLVKPGTWHDCWVPLSVCWRGSQQLLSQRKISFSGI
jgi:hypothetical protein